MLGMDSQGGALHLDGGIGRAAAGWLVYLLRSTLFVFALALLFAYLLSPLVNLLDRVLPDATHAHAGARPCPT